MNEEEYANYDYQTTTIPFKTEYGVTIGKETKSSFKLCTKDCVYKDNWNKLKEWLEEYIENIKMQYQNSEPISQYSLQVIIDTLQVTIDKMQEIEDGINEYI